MRILIPTLDKKDRESVASPHFGRAPYLALVETDVKGNIDSITFFTGEGPHEEHKTEKDASETGSIHGRVVDLKPDVIVAFMMGPKAVSDFSAHGIKLVSSPGRTISEIVSSVYSNQVKALEPHRE
ncbi:MAG: NifB/NifX family molybdenum-iron cluster-binding protein [Thermoplasmataceae archaeon]|jgi:predicted Fe-Mo cluster-binding NifX family protein